MSHVGATASFRRGCTSLPKQPTTRVLSSVVSGRPCMTDHTEEEGLCILPCESSSSSNATVVLAVEGGSSSSSSSSSRPRVRAEDGGRKPPMCGRRTTTTSGRRFFHELFRILCLLPRLDDDVSPERRGGREESEDDDELVGGYAGCCCCRSKGCRDASAQTAVVSCDKNDIIQAAAMVPCDPNDGPHPNRRAVIRDVSMRYLMIVTILILLLNCDLKTLLALLLWRYVRISRPPRMLCLDFPQTRKQCPLAWVEHIFHHILLFVSPEEALNLATTDKLFYKQVMDDEFWWNQVLHQLWGETRESPARSSPSSTDGGTVPELRYYYWWDLAEAVTWVIVCAGGDPVLFSWYIFASAVISRFFDRSPVLVLLRLSRLFVLFERILTFTWRPILQIVFLVIACLVALFWMIKPKLLFAHGPLTQVVASNPPKRFVFWSPVCWSDLGLKTSKLVIWRRAFEYYGEQEANLCHFIYEVCGDAFLCAKALRDLNVVQRRLRSLLRRVRVDIPDRFQLETKIVSITALVVICTCSFTGLFSPTTAFTY